MAQDVILTRGDDKLGIFESHGNSPSLSQQLEAISSDIGINAENLNALAVDLENLSNDISSFRGEVQDETASVSLRFDGIEEQITTIQSSIADGVGQSNRIRATVEGAISRISDVEEESANTLASLDRVLECAMQNKVTRPVCV